MLRKNYVSKCNENDLLLHRKVNFRKICTLSMRQYQLCKCSKKKYWIRTNWSWIIRLNSLTTRTVCSARLMKWIMTKKVRQIYFCLHFCLHFSIGFPFVTALISYTILCWTVHFCEERNTQFRRVSSMCHRSSLLSFREKFSNMKNYIFNI